MAFGRIPSEFSRVERSRVHGQLLHLLRSQSHFHAVSVQRKIGPSTKRIEKGWIIYSFIHSLIYCTISMILFIQIQIQIQIQISIIDPLMFLFSLFLTFFSFFL